MVFESCKLSGIKLKNRIIRSATHDGLAAADGGVTEKMIRKYEALAKNEVGLIVTGYAAVNTAGLSNYPRMSRIDNDYLIEDYRRLCDAVHAYDTPIVMQLAHCGRQTTSKATGQQKLAPSKVLHVMYPDPARAMTEAEIRQTIDDFAAAMIRAKEAGFDGVQLHLGHGYLLYDFISPHGNRRTDKWGGSTENRCRILKEILEKAPSDFPVFVKMSAYDHQRNGMRVEEAVRVAKLLEQYGCKGIEVSCGTVADGMVTMRSKHLPMEAVFQYREPVASLPKWINKPVLLCAKAINPFIKQPQPLENFNADAARKIKSAVSIPVILVGGIHRLSDMERFTSDGTADFVSLCRPFICEPNLVRKLREGKQTESKCLMCNYCGLVIEKEPTRCLYGKLK